MPLTLYKRFRKDGSFTWWARGTIGKTRHHEGSGTDRADLAEEWRAKREAELYRAALYGEHPSVAFSVAALSYLEHEPRGGHQKNYVGRLTEHFGETIISTIDQNAADAAVRAIVGAGAKPSTKRRNVYGPLIAILNHAHPRHWCDTPHFDLPKVAKPKTRFLTPAQAFELVAAAAGHLRPVFIFMLGTGARMVETLELQWVDVRLAEARVILRDTKNGKDRIAALPPAAVAALATLRVSAQPEQESHVFLHPEIGGAVEQADARMVPYVDRERLEGGQIKSGWRWACKRAGLIEWIDDDRWRPIFTPHDLRHTWATWFAAAANGNLHLLKDEGGWHSITMVERYAHLMAPELAPEIAMIWGGEHPRLRATPSLHHERRA